MDDEQQAFLNAIKHDPDDNLPRLVYADWLEENGKKPHADLIRWQCKYEDRDEPFNSEALSILGWHGRFLNGRICGWLDSVTRLLVFINVEGQTADKLYIRRGFIDEVHCTQHSWLSNGPEFVQYNPVRKVVLHDKTPEYLYNHRCKSHVYRYYYPPYAKYAAATQDISSQISSVIFDAFKDKNEGGFTVWVDLKTVEQAHDWLSQHCIKWAEMQAEVLA